MHCELWARCWLFLEQSNEEWQNTVDKINCEITLLNTCVMCVIQNGSFVSFE